MLKRLVFLGLFGYFAFIVTRSVLKLLHPQLGTSIRTVTSSHMLYPGISVCSTTYDAAHGGVIDEKEVEKAGWVNATNRTYLLGLNYSYLENGRLKST